VESLFYNIEYWTDLGIYYLVDPIFAGHTLYNICGEGQTTISDHQTLTHMK
jgi:hypothetical protein